jgi:hypothetical protein
VRNLRSANKKLKVFPKKRVLKKKLQNRSLKTLAQIDKLRRNKHL